MIKYSNNYSDISGSLWQFKRDEFAENNADFTISNPHSLNYKAALVGKTEDVFLVEIALQKTKK